MKKVFIFLLCICILAFSVPWALAVDVFESTLEEPHWGVLDSDVVYEDDFADGLSYKRFYFLLSTETQPYLVQFDFSCDLDPSDIILNQSANHVIGLRFTFSSTYQAFYFHASILDVLTGEVIQTPKGFQKSRSFYNVNFSLSNIVSCYFPYTNNSGLTLVNNVSWYIPSDYNPGEHAPVITSGDHFLQYPVSAEWDDWGFQFVQNPSDGTILSWPANFDIYTFNNMTFGRWTADRQSFSIFNVAYACGFFELLQGYNNIFYGNSFELTTNLYTTMDCDTYVIACSWEIGHVIANLLSSSNSIQGLSLKGRIDYLYNHLEDANFSDLDWYAIEKYSVNTLTGKAINPLSLKFNVPSNYADNRIVYFIIQAYDSGEHDRLGYIHEWGFSDICIDPFASSYLTVNQYRDQIRYQAEIIGSDEAGQESGIKGIFKKITELPGQISGYISGLGDQLMGSDEEGSESGLKGIVKKLKDLPDTLIDKIKGLFIPDDDFFEDYKSQFIELFEDHLGVLYQAPEMVISVIRELVAFEPVTGLLPQNYDIKFPAKSFFIEVDSAAEENQFDISEDPFTDDDSEFILLPDSGDGFYHVDLSFLANDPYSTLYSIFRAVTTVVLIISIIYFCIYKFNEILKGAPSGDN